MADSVHIVSVAQVHNDGSVTGRQWRVKASHADGVRTAMDKVGTLLGDTALSAEEVYRRAGLTLTAGDDQEGGR